MDPYSVLGVGKNATQDEIRKAYRSLAMKHHPDRGGNEEQFKAINEAYTAIGDSKKRAQYDSGFSYNSTNWDDIFRNSRRHQHRYRHQAQIRMSLNIDFETAIRGGKTMISVGLGDGISAMEIHIDPGVVTGDSARYSTGVGDLIVTFKVDPSKTWSRTNNNLTREYLVDVWDLVLGKQIEVETIFGERIKLKIPPKTQPDTLLRIKGKGAKTQWDGQGDMFVRVKAHIPTDISMELLRAIKEEVDNK
jgi:DnaJ-class molecular chaperone